MLQKHLLELASLIRGLGDRDKSHTAQEDTHFSRMQAYPVLPHWPWSS